jgi:hypothetical protein
MATGPMNESPTCGMAGTNNDKGKLKEFALVAIALQIVIVQLVLLYFAAMASCCWYSS